MEEKRMTGKKAENATGMRTEGKDVDMAGMNEKKPSSKKKAGRKKGYGKIKIGMTAYSALVLMMTLGTATVFAADDPIAVVNNLSTFIFGLIRAIGMILLGFGIVQIGLSLKSHDPSQRANGFLTLAGGVVITFAREILNTITG